MAKKQITYRFSDESVVDKRCVVYAFSDARTGELRYIGKTIGVLHRRVKRHLAAHYLKELTYKNNWLRGLLAAGYVPVVDVLEQCTSPDALIEAERFHIAYWRFIGARLTNGTDGGDGLTAGSKRSSEVCEKISRGLKGRVFSAEHCERISQAKRDVLVSDATKEKMRASHIGRVRPAWNQEQRRAISRGKGGRPVVDENGIRYETLMEATRALGLLRSEAWNVVHGHKFSTRGHTLHFVNVLT